MIKVAGTHHQESDKSLFFDKYMSIRMEKAATITAMYRQLISTTERQLISVNRFLSGDAWFESMVREAQFLNEELEDMLLQLQNIIGED